MLAYPFTGPVPMRRWLLGTAFPIRHDPARDKVTIMLERIGQLRTEADRLEAELISLAGMRCELRCSGCGEYLATELEFAAHFLVSDERYLNLGDCPKS